MVVVVVVPGVEGSALTSTVKLIVPAAAVAGAFKVPTILDTPLAARVFCAAPSNVRFSVPVADGTVFDPVNNSSVELVFFTYTVNVEVPPGVTSGRLMLVTGCVAAASEKKAKLAFDNTFTEAFSDLVNAVAP